MLRVESTLNKGRCFVASQSITKGSIVHESSPFSAVPDAESRQRVCGHCLDFVKLPVTYSCKTCQHIVYCSESCAQINLEQYHALECEFLKTVQFPSSYTSDYSWLLARVLIKLARTILRNEPLETFQAVWVLCDNQQDHPKDKIQEFRLVGNLLIFTIFKSSET